ncbi:MAG: PAS domain-containing protein [Lentisphaeria bacterium]|nr:PAS domain-containing protein [Lentisphaeria bacterium]
MHGKENSFLDRMIERLDRLDPANLQRYVLRLVREKEFLETLFDTVHEGLIVIDGVPRIRFINASACDMLGIPADSAGQRVDKYLRELDWLSLLEADPESGHRVSRQEIEVFYPEHRFLSIYLVPVQDRDLDEEAPLAAVILRDVTEAHRDREETIESQKVRAITMLAAGVAHELGNPLNSLNIHLQLLQRRLGESEDRELADEAEELLGVATGEVERLGGIVTNFLQAIRPVPLDLKPVNLRQILTEVLEFTRQEIEDRSIQVEASLPDALPQIMGDADQLKQAFYNILKNAVQAMPDGGRLDIHCAERGRFVDLCFRDSGEGISVENMSRIMNAYYTTKEEGTGLGLMIVDRIVRSHGGELRIESAEGEGAAFTISLPLRSRRIKQLETTNQAVIDVNAEMDI